MAMIFRVFRSARLDAAMVQSSLSVHIRGVSFCLYCLTVYRPYNSEGWFDFCEEVPGFESTGKMGLRRIDSQSCC